MSVKVSAIVLDYMKASHVVANVDSLLKQEISFPLKIFVADNSCSIKNSQKLEELKKYKNVELNINSQNIGYPKAHNQFNNKLEGDYVLVVNPDIVWKNKDTLQKIISYMEQNDKIGILGPKQINDDGKVAMTIRAFPRFYLQVARRTWLRYLPYINKKVFYDEMQHLDYNKIQDVDWLQSSCVIVRKKLWDELGGLNEMYFLFMTDVDLCYRVWQKNYKVVYYPEAEVFADGIRVSSGGFIKFFKSWVLRQHVKDSLKFRLLHFLDKNPRTRYYEKK